MSEILEDIVSEGERLLGIASRDGVPLRLLGGIAVRLKAPSVPPSLDRAYKDIDFAVTKKGGGAADKLLRDAGYEPHVAFNAMHARERGLFSTTSTAARWTCSSTPSACATRSRWASGCESRPTRCRWRS